jgi:hypothetical protein
MDLTFVWVCGRLVSTSREGVIMDERYEKLADLIFRISDGAESLDSDDVRVGNARQVWSDLSYLKSAVDKAYSLVLDLANDEGRGK